MQFYKAEAFGVLNLEKVFRNLRVFCDFKLVICSRRFRPSSLCSFYIATKQTLTHTHYKKVFHSSSHTLNIDAKFGQMFCSLAEKLLRTIWL